ncbi:unnamed protein product [Mytilus edulis]|uniref:Endonuclease/exonuclease/phosphatase domain-containing protein n=1 Tax=Mytilus edulis TaxID=6550 RepID=A0A8S3Q0Y9_MYTED|nr:unnamed protein product [Mytilus edulis]
MAAATESSSSRVSKPPSKFSDCLMGVDFDKMFEDKPVNDPSKIEIAVEHPQLVIQGAKCTAFSDQYFTTLKSKIEADFDNEVFINNHDNTAVDVHDVSDNDCSQTKLKQLDIETIDSNNNSTGIIELDTVEDNKTSTPSRKSKSSVNNLSTPKDRVLQHGKDIYLAAVYVSPENSSCNVPDLNSVYAHLLSDIEKYCKLGDIMVQGDFNAHTNTSPDYVLFDESKQPYVVDNYYVEDSIMPRNNLDPKRINNSGRCLLDLCKETSLTILNGRTIGDLHGKQSCITYNGCSLVDYTLVSFDLLSLVGYFEIHDLTSLSNHCPISCTLLTFFRSTNFVNQTQLDPLPGKFIWSPGAIESYVKDITSKENKTKLVSFTNNSCKSSDSAVQSLTSIYMKVQKYQQNAL